MSKNAKKTSKGETGIIDADFKQKVEQYIADFIHNENLVRIILLLLIKNG